MIGSLDLLVRKGSYDSPCSYLKICILSSFPKVPPPQPASLLKKELSGPWQPWKLRIDFSPVLVLYPEEKPSLNVVTYPGESGRMGWGNTPHLA